MQFLNFDKGPFINYDLGGRVEKIFRNPPMVAGLNNNT